MKKDNFDYSVEDYVFQNMLRDLNKKSIEAGKGNRNIISSKNIEQALWKAIPISYCLEEEVEVKTVVGAFYSALNRKNYEEVVKLIVTFYQLCTQL